VAIIDLKRPMFL